MEWKIFYSNSTYSDLDGPPELAPKRDVQTIAVKSESAGRRIERGSDFYIWTPDNGVWRGVDFFGLYDYMIEPGMKIVLFGRVLSDDEYSQIWLRAAHDPDLPPKSAYLPDERKP